MFKHADPSRRLPMYLQPNTVENVTWQLKLLGVYIAGMMVYSYIEEKREAKRRARWSNPES